jgi:glucuronate isomerase
MKPFLDDQFLLHSSLAEELYHVYAKPMPVIDYHNHLSPALLDEDHRFPNITKAWLDGDHYKWRAMRTHGLDESFCTGDAPDEDKFHMWAGTVPYTLRNPLYHWTHLELQRYFGIHELLNPHSAGRIWEQCNALLQEPGMSVRGLVERMQVEIICTTDDPVDSLIHHRHLRASGWKVRVLPAFRPDKCLQVDDAPVFNAYLAKLEAASGVDIACMGDFLEAIRRRHDYFAEQGCCIADHGLAHVHASAFTIGESDRIFDKLRSNHQVTEQEAEIFKSFLLQYLAELNAEKGWVQQFHLGALRNNNTRMMRALGPDTGWDSIGDAWQGQALARFLDRLDQQGKLARTILYNLNPSDNALFATMTGNFNDGSMAGKIQWGSAWWFLDQQDGMRDQLNTLSRMGLVSHFVGMLTDSRSFLSFPRHEYFRRLLSNLFAEDMLRGEIPHDVEWTGKIIQDICYHNTRNYFPWPEQAVNP